MRQPPRDGAAGLDLVLGIAVGVQVADRDRVDTLASELCQGGGERAAAERDRHGAVEPHPLAHAEASRARHERDRRRHAEVVAVVLQALAHLDDIAVALGRQEPDASALLLQECVGDDRRAVDDRLRPRQEARHLEPELGREEAEPFHEPLGGIPRRRGALGDDDAPRAIHRGEVGEGAAHVDADPVHAAQTGRRSAPGSGWTSKALSVHAIIA